MTPLRHEATTYAVDCKRIEWRHIKMLGRTVCFDSVMVSSRFPLHDFTTFCGVVQRKGIIARRDRGK